MTGDAPGRRRDGTGYDPRVDHTSDPVLRLGRRGRAWRWAATATALGILTAGQVLDTNDLFPLGSLSQYATARDPNGTVRSTFMTAVRTDGREVRVPLNATGVGVGRAEIEGQVQRIVDDPSLLQGIARAWSGLHPDAPAYETVSLKRSTYQLRDGRPVGRGQEETLAVWEVRR